MCSTIQQRTVLIIPPLIVQTIIIAQVLSNGGKGLEKVGAELKLKTLMRCLHVK